MKTKQALQGVPHSEIQVELDLQLNSLLQAGICHIFSLAESPSWSRVNKTTFKIWSRLTIELISHLRHYIFHFVTFGQMLKLVWRHCTKFLDDLKAEVRTQNEILGCSRSRGGDTAQNSKML